MDLETLLQSHNLSDHASAIRSLVRPSIGIQRSSTSQERLKPGDSRLGGLPHCRPGTEWPRWGAEVLSHVATINLADASPQDREGLLPREGLLQFWYVQDQSAWGHDSKEAGAFRVDYIPAREINQLVPLDPPTDAQPFEPCSIRFEPRLTVASWQWIAEHAPQHQPLNDLPDFEAFTQALHDDQMHRMLGHASPVQSAMEEECQLVTHGVNCGTAHDHHGPRIRELQQGVLDWRLLLQLDTDESGPGWMWGDVGTIYFWIPITALRERQFEKAWMIFQCC